MGIDKDKKLQIRFASSFFCSKIMRCRQRRNGHICDSHSVLFSDSWKTGSAGLVARSLAKCGRFEWGVCKVLTTAVAAAKEDEDGGQNGQAHKDDDEHDYPLPMVCPPGRGCNLGHIAGVTDVRADGGAGSFEGSEVSRLAETRFVDGGVGDWGGRRDAAGLSVLEDCALLGARGESRVAVYKKLLGRGSGRQRCDNGNKTHGGWIDV
ncbi:hypothetical protein KCU79_g136, partial [Aureobasidium melanogenum]